MSKKKAVKKGIKKSNKNKGSKGKSTNLAKILIAVVLVLAVTAIILLAIFFQNEGSANDDNPCIVSCDMHPVSGECHCHGHCGTVGCLCHGAH